MAKVPRPVMFEIDDGEDYVIVWMSPTGKMTVTSVAGNYELEKIMLERMHKGLTAVVEADGSKMPEMVMGIVVDH